jgi:translation initiation factor IF-2
MPVRIYEIAKEVGVESKVVLAKAKELNISNARVASSSIDKITAEYLVDKLRQELQPAEPEPPVQPEPEPPPESAPAPEPPPVDTPAAEEVPTSPAAEEPPTDEVLAEGPTATAPAGTSAIPEPEAAAPAAPPETETAKPTEQPAPDTATDAAPATESPTSPEPTEPVATGETSEPPAPSQEPAPPEQPTEEAPTTKEPSAPEPPEPRTGQLVGRIKLGDWAMRGRRDRDRGRGKKDAKGRDGQTEKSGRTEPQGAGRSSSSPSAPGPKLPPMPRPETLTAGELTMKPPIIIRDLAERLKRKPHQIIADLMEMGVFATVNQSIEPEMAQRVCVKYKIRFKLEKREKGGALVKDRPKKLKLDDKDDKPEDLQPRAPVITIMGHVDHGKTTLLDAIRKSNVVAGEAGGITQHIGAYTIHFPHPERPEDILKITFIDTPGHAAFSAMRARGANVTDIVILVVAAEEGVKPQTLEALDHAKAAEVPIIVAVNKCDHPAANPMRARQQLQERGLMSDEWGGDTIFVDVSAITKESVDKLLEMILLQAEILELKANPNRLARGNVIESGIEPGGPTATVLVRKGTLRPGDVLVCGPYYGRVRALINEDGKRLKEAGPSDAVKVLGLNGVPEAGALFDVAENERLARQLCEERHSALRKEQLSRPKVPRSLRDVMSQLDVDTAKILKVFVKADTQGSVEAIVDSLNQIESDKVTLEVISSGVGNITETDVSLASASGAIILGFHAKIDHAAAEAAKREAVEIRLYAIIYELVDEVRLAMAGLLDPLLREVTTGTAEVRKIFELSKGGNVAGCAVTNGRVIRGKARVIRRKNRIYEGLVNTLRRYQDEVNEVRTGMECGIRLEGFDDFQEGDIIESYTVEKEQAQL